MSVSVCVCEINEYCPILSSTEQKPEWIKQIIDNSPDIPVVDKSIFFLTLLEYRIHC